MVQGGYGTDLAWASPHDLASDFASVDTPSGVQLAASRHGRRMVPAYRRMLESHRSSGGAPTAHDGLTLLLSISEWFVRTRGSVLDWNTPAPWILESFAQAHGVGPLVHNGQDSILRVLSLVLPAWYRRRGTEGSLRWLMGILLGIVEENLRLERLRLERLRLDARRGSPADEPPAAARSPERRARQERVRVLETLVDRFRQVANVLGMPASSGPRTTAGAAVTSDGQLLSRELLAAYPSRWWAARIDESAARQQPPGLVILGDSLLMHDPQTYSHDPVPRRKSDLLLRWQRGRSTPVEILRMFPPWTVVRPCLASAPPAASTHVPHEDHSMAHAEPSSVTLFHPRNGSRLDLESLQAIADVPGRVWHAFRSLFPDSVGTTPSGGAFVLSGLAIRGNPSQHGPPGSVEVQGVEELMLQPGTALLPIPTAPGRAALVQIHEALPVRLPARLGSLDDDAAVARTVVVRLQLESAGSSESAPRAPGERQGAWEAARQDYRPVLSTDLFTADELEHFLARPAHERGLVVAARVPRRRRWMTDISALFRPEDRRTRSIIQALEVIERRIWMAVPHGLRWHQGVLGSDWLRYQTAASAALQAAVMTLETRVLSTGERVRLLTSLQRRVGARVEEAADRIEALFGPNHPFNPYRASGDSSET
jgi:hypothetical protein